MLLGNQSVICFKLDYKQAFRLSFLAEECSKTTQKQTVNTMHRIIVEAQSATNLNRSEMEVTFESNAKIDSEAIEDRYRVLLKGFKRKKKCPYE
jgi:hypothetical protein